MSITYFPEIYEDELVYSVLARFYVHSGYPAYAFCAEDTFVNKRVRPDVEFLNEMEADVVKALCRNISMEELIKRHTMFPYYGRFLPFERRNRAFQALCDMAGDYNNLLPIPKHKNGDKSYLRYCPLCAEEDRTFYGETYWHRSHQMMGVLVCVTHGCRLLNSSVIISGKASPSLITAEQEISGQEEFVTYGNEVERQLAEYVGKVFQADMDMLSSVSVGQFLHYNMSGTEYLSVRGEQRNIQKFYDDFMEFYKELHMQGLTELWQLQKVFNNYRFNCYEVCQMAMFLDIPIEKLCHMEIPDISQQQIFDNKIKELHVQGLKYPEIARRLNASYNVVKPIGNGRYGKHTKVKEEYKKCGAKPKNWEKIDKEFLPRVEKAVRQLQGIEGKRPHRVTEFAVCKLLGVHSQILKTMPMCRTEVLKHQEPQEQYWAREIVWAIGKIQREGKTLNWKQIRVITNMRKDNVLASLPYLKNMAEPEVYEQVLAIF